MSEIHWWKTEGIWAEAARCPLQLCLSVCLDLFNSKQTGISQCRVHLMPIPWWTETDKHYKLIIPLLDGYPGRCGGNIFSTIWVIFTMLEWNFPQNLDSQVFFQGWIIVMIVFCLFRTQSNTRHFHLSVSILHGQTEVSLEFHINACVPWFRIPND